MVTSGCSHRFPAEVLASVKDDLLNAVRKTVVVVGEATNFGSLGETGVQAQPPTSVFATHGLVSSELRLSTFADLHNSQRAAMTGGCIGDLP